MTRPVFILGLSLALSPGAPAAEYFVAPGGNNNNSGTLGSPWATVAKATATAGAGDTVFFRAGTYGERLVAPRSGTAANPIAFRAYPNETPVLDATAVAFSDDAGIVDIRNKSHLVVDGFEIRNLTTSNSSKVPIGVFIYGDPFTGGTAPTNIVVENCRVHDIRNTHNSDGNAHGIIARGEIVTPLSGIVIRNNEIYNNKLGYSEALVINGNVDGFEISGNSVHDNDNIGIDIIGFETGLSPAIDFARNGVVRDNTVYNCSSFANPLYNEYSAGGIYVDGGALTLIERNRVYQCDIGLELASEHPGRSTRDITVRDNIFWRNTLGGIFTGGYDAQRGATDNCTITNNTLYENDTLFDGTGEILIRNFTNNLSVRNNLIVANSDGVFIQKDSANTTAIAMDYNVFFSSIGQNNSAWQWRTGGGNGSITGFSNFRNTSGTNTNSLWANPLFLNTSGAVGSYDFRIPSDSPARNAGDPAFVPASGETDIAGNPRVAGGRVDAGAYEATEALTALEAWRFFYFGTIENAGPAANGANGDHDSLENLLEFTLDRLNPTIPDTSDAVPDFDANGDYAFRLNEGAIDSVTLRVQSTADLDTWTDIATHAPGGNWIAVPGVSVTTVSRTITLHDARSRSAEGVTIYRLTASE
jgi:hypothetical protein